MTETTADPLTATIAATTARLETALEKDKVIPPPPPDGGPEAPEAAPEAPEAAPEPEATGIPVDLGEEAVAGLVDGIFNTVAIATKQDHWQLQEYERDNLAKATKAVLDYYAVKLTPVAMLVFWAGMTVVPRTYLSMMMKKPEKSPEAPPPPPAKPGKAAEAAPEGPKAKTGWSADDKQ